MVELPTAMRSLDEATQKCEAALRRRILESPQSDEPRLLYADWLERSGDPEWASLIRRYCEHTRHYTCQCKDGEHEEKCEFLRCYPWPSDDEEGQNDVRIVTARSRSPLPAPGRLDVDRGFIGSLKCTCDFFLAHAKELFSEHPITGVTLAGKAPMRKGYAWGFTCVPPGTPPDDPIVDAHFVLPRPIWEYYADIAKWANLSHGSDRGWTSVLDEHVPLVALGAACVNYGRTLAGLPYLLRDYRRQWPSPNFM